MVKEGETLIGAYYLTDSGESVKCLAVGFAEIKVTANVSLYYGEDSEDNMEAALNSTALYSDKVLEKSCKVSPYEDGVKYDVTFSYLVTVAINME